MSPVATNLVAFVVTFLYASFFEWMFHKHLFHSPKLIKATFKAHQIVHHQKYKYDPSSYEWTEGRSKDHISMDWFALPVFIGVHLPFLFLAQWLTGTSVIYGGLGAVIAYYTVYEYFHYCMHVPNNRLFERTKVFKFVKEHHRAHHKFMQRNLNVFFPLADVVLGTYTSQAKMNELLAKKPSAPAMPTGETAPRTAPSMADLRPKKPAEAVSKQ